MRGKGNLEYFPNLSTRFWTSWEREERKVVELEREGEDEKIGKKEVI